MMTDEYTVALTKVRSFNFTEWKNNAIVTRC